MRKIDEERDWSERVLDIDIDSPVFQELLQDLDGEIHRCIQKVYDKEFEGGEISLKLTIELPDAFKVFPKVDKETGEMINETFMYRKPKFEHKLTTTLKKQFKTDGGYTDEREVQFENGKFIAVPVKDAQLKISDLTV